MRTLPAIVLTVMTALPTALNAAEPATRPVTPSVSAVTLNIEAQSLEGALNAFAAQTGLQVVYYSKVEHGLRVPALSGKFSPQAALRQLLANTALDYKFLNPRTVAIRSAKEGSASGASAADQMRLAAEEAQARQEAGAGHSATKVDMVVEDKRVKPYTDANVDIARTIDDAQPYYIFDAKTIERSGATNVEDFLKQRLTMNTLAQGYGELSGSPSTLGSISSVDLRGLGRDKTLILINGRRLAGVNNTTTDRQPSLNGIPVGAIDRIEVLPSSASGIYGGSAIGGVVNVILKQDYSGGEARVGYDNSSDGDSPLRSVSASYGLAVEGGRTHLSFNAAWSDKKALLLRDRVELFRDSMADILSRVPNFISSSTTPWLGSLPNITSTSYYDPVTFTYYPDPGTLTLKSGTTPLNARSTHIPAGTSAGTSPAALNAALLARAGQWNLDFPLSTQAPTGLLQPFGATPKTRSFQVSLRRQMLPWLEMLSDLAWNENATMSISHPARYALTVPASAPTNPFTSGVAILVPDATELPFTSRSQNRSATLGAIAQLPGGWTGMADYTWSENRLDYSFYESDSTAMNAALANGQFNPFVDTLLHPLDFRQFVAPRAYQGKNRQQTLALRGSGPLPALPWGRPNLTVGLERNLNKTPERFTTQEFPVTTANNVWQVHYARGSTMDSAYLEAAVPLIREGWLPGLRSVELQLSGRGERYTVDTGTPSQQILYNRNPPAVSYGGPTLNGQPFFSEASYKSNNYTVGLKYQPVRDVTLRMSRATAFIPPTPSQLLKNPLPSTSASTIFDPTLNPAAPPAGCTVVSNRVRCPVFTLSGGNPDLMPQNSRSLSAGIIWEPRFQPLSGLRLNAEYYRIEQYDAIGTLGLQVLVDQETAYPGRVQRGANGAITLVDTSMLNLYYRDTEGWDLSLDYALETPRGRFSFHAVESIILHLKDQYAQTLPAYEAAGHHPGDGGAPKYKTNATLSWESGPLAMSWTARYLASYKQWGAAGGPYSTRSLGGAAENYYINAQGAGSVASQTYHDLFVSYAFGGGQPAASSFLSGVAVQLGVRNVFDSVPPLDAYSNTGIMYNYYRSPYGDLRLRSYWLSLKLDF